MKLQTFPIKASTENEVEAWIQNKIIHHMTMNDTVVVFLYDETGGSQ